MIWTRERLSAGVGHYIQDCTHDLAGRTFRSDKDKLDKVIRIANYHNTMRGNVGVNADVTDLYRYED